MPIRNVLKVDVPDSYYHVYARGHNKQKIFLDEHDYRFFISLFERYLSGDTQQDSSGVPYPHLIDRVELLCYCLMPNHFHLLLYQHEEKGMQSLMRGVMTSYSRYFNKKYQRTGSLFESSYKASLIVNQSYLEHISRYIHLNRKNWRTTPYSSIGFYLDGKTAEWIKPERIKVLFVSAREYEVFLSNYEEQKEMLEKIKHDLANDI